MGETIFNMRAMTLAEIQAQELEILKDFHAFCVEKGLTYSLYGGTMLGAIRHGGFIPWDDDLDVAMPRQDYEKFVAEYPSDNSYELHCLERGNSMLAFSRICEMSKTWVKQSLPWCKHETGVYIDVFPLDGAPDEQAAALRFEKQLHKKWMCLKLSRVALRELKNYPYAKMKTNILIRKMLFRNPITRNIDWLGRLDRACKQIPFGSTSHFINASFGEYGMKEYQLLEDFKYTVLKSFEGEMFCVCNGYDRLMRTKYGDYMQLPPEHQRKQKHGGSKFFWKNS